MNLKPQFRDLWTDRKHADHVILIDYDTTMEKFHKNPTLPIGNLKEAIYKFDSQVTLKSEPRLLDGGFHNWILHYPTFVTDSNWKREEVKGKSDGSLIDEHLDYPELPGEKKVEKKGDGNHQVNVLLDWRDASLNINTLDSCIEGMHLSIDCTHCIGWMHLSICFSAGYILCSAGSSTTTIKF